MVDTTKILGELLGGGRGSGTLNSEGGAKMLEDLLGVGSGGPRSGSAGATSGGRDNPFTSGQSQSTPAPAPGGSGGGGLGDLLGKALKEIGNTGGASGAGTGAVSNNPFETPVQTQPDDQNAHSEVYLRAMIQAGLSCLLYTSPSPRDLSTSRMPSSA